MTKKDRGYRFTIWRIDPLLQRHQQITTDKLEDKWPQREREDKKWRRISFGYTIFMYQGCIQRFQQGNAVCDYKSPLPAQEHQGISIIDRPWL